MIIYKVICGQCIRNKGDVYGHYMGIIWLIYRILHKVIYRQYIGLYTRRMWTIFEVVCGALCIFYFLTILGM
jgi:hypothetical protein